MLVILFATGLKLGPCVPLIVLINSFDAVRCKTCVGCWVCTRRTSCELFTLPSAVVQAKSCTSGWVWAVQRSTAPWCPLHTVQALLACSKERDRGIESTAGSSKINLSSVASSTAGAQGGSVLLLYAVRCAAAPIGNCEMAEWS